MHFLIATGNATGVNSRCMSKKTQRLGGIRVTESASAILEDMARRTGMSVNASTSWCINKVKELQRGATTPQSAQNEYEALCRVQSELQLARERVGKARKELNKVRDRKTTT